MQKIKILIADDHRLFREGLCKLLETEEDIECVGMAANGDEAIDLARKTSPDVALLDIAMPKKNGIRAAQEIVTASPNTAVIIITAYRYDEYLSSSINAGIKGYLLKDTDVANIISAIHTAHDNNDKLEKRFTNSKIQGENQTSTLSQREVEVLRLVSQGKTNREIAECLCLKSKSITSHLTHILNKLGVRSRTEAALIAVSRGLIYEEPC